MIKLDLIEFSELIHPQDIVNEIIKQNPSISAPVSLEQIAQASGITDIQYKPLDGLEGALVANAEKTCGVILIKENVIPQRKRFTLGHELGHFLIPRHGHEMKCTVDDMQAINKKTLTKRQRIELEANQFSANILMPEFLCQNFQGFKDVPSINCPIEMASYFDVSFEACANRYVTLHDEPIAIIFSCNGIIRYSRKSPLFPFWVTPGKGQPIPCDSFSKANFQGKSNFVSKGCSDSTTWLEKHQDYVLPNEILEDIYVMERGYAITLLYFDEAIEDASQ